MMNISKSLPLLGNISPQAFMRDYWQKKPLLIQGAIPAHQLKALPSREHLLGLAADENIPSRLIQNTNNQWHLKHGPFSARQLPSRKKTNWTILVQGVDLVDPATHALLNQFRFIPDSRLDDAMYSFATLDGGVGPHFDSYDVFLLQTSGARRWRIGAQKNLNLIEDAPLKILERFQPSKEYVLQAGDMLYLPPRYAHEGVAVSSPDAADCITCSIGFRAPQKHELARELLDRIAEDTLDEIGDNILYRDPKQSATKTPSALPPELIKFAQKAVATALGSPADLEIYLGEYLTEPKPEVSFQACPDAIPWSKVKTLRLNAATKMQYSKKHIFINGESYAASGPDAKLMQQLANERELHQQSLRVASTDAKALLQNWLEAGWCHA